MFDWENAIALHAMSLLASGAQTINFYSFTLLGSRYFVKTDTGADPHGVCVLAARACPTLCDPRTVARQALLSTGFSRREYCSGLPCPFSGRLPNPGTEPTSLNSSALAGESFTTSATWEVRSKMP